MTERESDQRFNSAVEAAVERAFVKSLSRLLGVDMADQESVNALWDDLRFVRRTRLAAEARRVDITKSFITAAIGGAFTAAATWASGLWKFGGH